MIVTSKAASGATMSLVKLCKDGDLEGVKAALQSGVDVNTKGELGRTGLIEAVRYNHSSVVELLLKTPNIDVNQKAFFKDKGGWSALHSAVARVTRVSKVTRVTSNDVEVLKLLLNVPNIDVNIEDNDGESALVHAVRGNNLVVLKLLLNVPSVHMNSVNSNCRSRYYGFTALHWAVENSVVDIKHNIEVFKLLLNHPSLTTLTLNQKDKDMWGGTPVLLAVIYNRLEHLALLVADPRVDLDTRGCEGRSLEDWARWLFLLESSAS